MPPLRTRRPEFLSLAEREEISRGLAAGESVRAIARRLGRPPSTISREIKRNKGAEEVPGCRRRRLRLATSTAAEAVPAGAAPSTGAVRRGQTG
ncbi:MAG: helix-turn-helix domain-containing protein [Acidimicrobiia bacterium]